MIHHHLIIRDCFELGHSDFVISAQLNLQQFASFAGRK
jgi:hypothetical protein